MKKIIGCSIVMTMIMANVCFAGIYDLEMSAGSSTLEARFNATLPLDKGFLTTGLGAIYNDDDYKIADITLALSNEIFLSELKFNLGFKGLLGKIEKDHKDGDLMAAGLAFSMKYSIPKSIAPIPIGISAGVSWAPDPVCFLDSDKYLGFRTNLHLCIVKNGAIIIGYRHIKIGFDDDHGQWEKSAGTFFVGYQVRY